MEVVRACRYVDAVIPQQDMDNFAQWEKVKFDLSTTKAIPCRI